MVRAQFYLMRFVSEGPPRENRRRAWFTVEEARQALSTRTRACSSCAPRRFHRSTANHEAAADLRRRASRCSAWAMAACGKSAPAEQAAGASNPGGGDALRRLSPSPRRAGDLPPNRRVACSGSDAGRRPRHCWSRSCPKQRAGRAVSPEASEPRRACRSQWPTRNTRAATARSNWRSPTPHSNRC